MTVPAAGLNALSATFSKASTEIHQRSQDKVRDSARGVEAGANAGSDQLGVGAVTTYGSDSATVTTTQPVLNQAQGGVAGMATNAVAAGQRLGQELADLGAQLLTRGGS